MELTSEMLGPYRECLMDEGRSRAMVEKYLRDARRFLEYLGDDGRVDKEKAREFRQELMERYEIGGVNSVLAAVDSLLGFVERGDLKAKLLEVQKTTCSRPEREVTEKEYEGLARTVKRLGDLRMSMLLRAVGSTGIRISELKFITVESPGTGRAEIYSKGKPRVVLLSVGLTRLLKKYCREAGVYTGSIFIIRQGNPLDRSNMSRKMKQLGREAGVDVAKVSPHNLRHLFARVSYSVKKDMVRLMDLLGHSNISTTRIYTIIAEEQPRRQTSWMKLVSG